MEQVGVAQVRRLRLYAGEQRPLGVAAREVGTRRLALRRSVLSAWRRRGGRRAGRARPACGARNPAVRQIGERLRLRAGARGSTHQRRPQAEQPAAGTADRCQCGSVAQHGDPSRTEDLPIYASRRRLQPDSDPCKIAGSGAACRPGVVLRLGARHVAQHPPEGWRRSTQQRRQGSPAKAAKTLDAIGCGAETNHQPPKKADTQKATVCLSIGAKVIL